MHAAHCRYYLNGVDAFRLKLLLPLTQQQQDEIAARELERLSLGNGDSDGTAGPSQVTDASLAQQQQSSKEQSQEQNVQSSGLKGQSQQRKSSPSQSDEDSNLLQRLEALRT